jgi:hypothetical protein
MPTAEPDQARIRDHLSSAQSRGQEPALVGLGSYIVNTGG